MAMINWLNNSQAIYVIAAYGFAGICLTLLLALSWIDARRAHNAWQKIQGRRHAEGAEDKDHGDFNS